VGHPRGERLRAEAVRLLASGVANNVFPCAAAAISYPGASGKHEMIVASAGVLAPGGKPVDDDTPFDLASLTKPVVATIALRLVAKGLVTLDLRPEQVLADTRGTPGGAVTLEQLLTHRSGLAAWGGLYLDVPHDPGTSAAKRWMLAEACRRTDEGPPGRVIYSDLGYIVAGETIARASGRDLDELLTSEVHAPLAIPEAQLFYAAALSAEKQGELARKAAATERDEWRGRLLRGEVHDENCHAFGGVSGHAGLFGTARGVASFARGFLDASLGRSGYLPKILVDEALRERPGGTHRLGWDGKSVPKPSAQHPSPESAAGKRASPRTFGHLGFTGTSVWCDPDRDLVVALLTNRVCPSRANEKIKGFRPAFYDGVFALFDAG
jgi:CubicO group peptidase (beta-lactamase class C family)